MVKLPGLDDLKKMGSDLIDSAKTVKFGEMLDKVKAGVESVSGKKAPIVVTDEKFKEVFQNIFTTLNQLAEAQAVQVNALKQAEKQLEELAKLVEASVVTPTVSTVSSSKIEEKKDYE